MRVRDPLLHIEHVNQKLVRRPSGLYLVHQFGILVPADTEVKENPVGGTAYPTVVTSVFSDYWHIKPDAVFPIMDIIPWKEMVKALERRY